MDELRQRTTRYLATTLPLDSGKAIMFLPEQGASEIFNTESKTSQEQLSSSLSGMEAKTFYEEVISLPQEQKRGIPKEVAKERKRKSRKCSSKGKSRAIKERAPTIGQVFRFAQDGDLESLKKALTEGYFDVNITDNFNWTLLMSAAFAGHTDTVEYLLRSGAQWRTIVDVSGQNAVDLAQSAGHSRIAELIEYHNDPDFNTQKDVDILCGTGSMSHRSMGSHEDTERRRENEEPFFCELCQLTISQDVPHRHNTSTLHQFNCQHHPSPHTVYAIPQCNRGYQMLLKRGWDPEGGLGSEQQGQQFPVKTILKRDRLGFGITGKAKARVTHFEAGDTAAVKRPREEKAGKQHTKRDILRTASKDKQWEHRMRQYLSSDHDY